MLLSVLAERRLRGGDPADLGALLGDLTKPPVDAIGALPIDSFLAKTERRSLEQPFGVDIAFADAAPSLRVQCGTAPGEHGRHF